MFGRVKFTYFLFGSYGLGFFDAMIVDLFLNTCFPMLVTAYKEIGSNNPEFGSARKVRIYTI